MYNIVQEMKLRSIGPSSNTITYVQEDWKEMGDNIINTLKEKLQELLLALENFGNYLLNSFDKLFPPETREDKIRHWLHVATPYLIVAVIVVTVFFLCRCCCPCCCCGGRRSSIKMMKAPGRDYRMPRHKFESNPRGYFRDLRGKPSSSSYNLV